MIRALFVLLFGAWVDVIALRRLRLESPRDAPLETSRLLGRLPFVVVKVKPPTKTTVLKKSQDMSWDMASNMKRTVGTDSKIMCGATTGKLTTSNDLVHWEADCVSQDPVTRNWDIAHWFLYQAFFTVEEVPNEEGAQAFEDAQRLHQLMESTSLGMLPLLVVTATANTVLKMSEEYSWNLSVAQKRTIRSGAQIFCVPLDSGDLKESNDKYHWEADCISQDPFSHWDMGYWFIFKQFFQVNKSKSTAIETTLDVGGERAEHVAKSTPIDITPDVVRDRAVHDEDLSSWITNSQCTDRGWEVFKERFGYASFGSVVTRTAGLNAPISYRHPSAAAREALYFYTGVEGDPQCVFQVTSRNTVWCARLLQVSRSHSVHVAYVNSVEEAHVILQGYADASINHFVLGGHGSEANNDMGIIWGSSHVLTVKSQIKTAKFSNNLASLALLRDARRKLTTDSTVFIVGCLHGRSENQQVMNLLEFTAIHLKNNFWRMFASMISMHSYMVKLGDDSLRRRIVDAGHNETVEFSGDLIQYIPCHASFKKVIRPVPFFERWASCRQDCDHYSRKTPELINEAMDGDVCAVAKQKGLFDDIFMIRVNGPGEKPTFAVLPKFHARARVGSDAPVSASGLEEVLRAESSSELLAFVWRAAFEIGNTTRLGPALLPAACSQVGIQLMMVAREDWATLQKRIRQEKWSCRFQDTMSRPEEARV